VLPAQAGELVEAVGGMKSCTSLNISGSLIAGTIPPQIGEMTRLESLLLEKTSISGTLPSELSSLVDLELLSVYQNPQLSGSLPPEFSAMSKLRTLDVHLNALTGSIPPEYGAWTQLSWFDVASNVLTGTLPASIIFPLAQYWDIHDNMISGTLPDGMDAMKTLLYLPLQKNMLTGSLPSWDMSQLLYFSVAGNQFSGTVPNSLGQNAGMSFLDLKDNAELSGTLPASFGSMTQMAQFQASSTKIGGTLPPELAAWTSISTFHVQLSQIGGTLPPEYSAWTQATLFVAFGTAISGSLPAEWGAMTSMYAFNLENCAIEGQLPAELVQSPPSLAYLFLSGNNITGTLPPEYGQWSTMLLFGVANNQISGTLPPEYAGMTTLSQFFANDNALTGAVPWQYERWVSIEKIHLQNNGLSGSFPLLPVNELLLSHNLYAKLPDNITRNQYLQVLDLSHNVDMEWIPSGAHESDNAYETGEDGKILQSNCGAHTKLQHPESNMLGLQTLSVSGCQLKVTAHQFLASLAYLPQLQLVSAVQAGLGGDVFEDAFRSFTSSGETTCEGHREPEVGFPQLNQLDLSSNSIRRFAYISKEKMIDFNTLMLRGNMNMTIHENWLSKTATTVDLLNTGAVIGLESWRSSTGSCSNRTRLGSDLQFAVGESDPLYECSGVCGLGNTIRVDVLPNWQNLCRCIAGYWNDVGGTGHCATCPENHYCPIGVQQPIPCGVGRQSEAGAESADQCVCMPGFEDNAGECTVCPEGSFKSVPGPQRCTQCRSVRPYSVAPPGSLTEDACVCRGADDGQAGFYRAERVLDSVVQIVCEACPSPGGRCENQTVLAEPGYFMVGPVQPLACSHKINQNSVCQGNSLFNQGDSQCLEGHSGFLCASCAPGYARENDEDSCVTKCSDLGGAGASIVKILMVHVMEAAAAFIAAFCAAQAQHPYERQPLNEVLLRTFQNWVVSMSFLASVDMASMQMLPAKIYRDTTQRDLSDEVPGWFRDFLKVFESAARFSPLGTTPSMEAQCMAEDLGLDPDWKVLLPAVQMLVAPAAGILTILIIAVMMRYLVAPILLQRGVISTRESEQKQLRDKIRGLQQSVARSMVSDGGNDASKLSWEMFEQSFWPAAEALLKRHKEHNVTESNFLTLLSNYTNASSTEGRVLAVHLHRAEILRTLQEAGCHGRAAEWCWEQMIVNSHDVDVARLKDGEIGIWMTEDPGMSLQGLSMAMAAKTLISFLSKEVADPGRVQVLFAVILLNADRLNFEQLLDDPLGVIQEEPNCRETLQRVTETSTVEDVLPAPTFGKMNRAGRGGVAAPSSRHSLLRLAVSGGGGDSLARIRMEGVLEPEYPIFSLFRIGSLLDLLVDCVRIILIFLWANWVQVVTRFLQLLNCEEFPGVSASDPEQTENSLRYMQDPDVICYEGVHQTLAVLAVIGLSVWGAAVLLLITGACSITKHHKGLHSPQTQRLFGYLLHGLRPRFWYWELIVKRLDLLLCGIIAHTSIVPNKTSKVLVFCMLSTAALMAQIRYEPFDGRQARLMDSIERASLQARCFTYWAVVVLLIADADSGLAIFSCLVVAVVNATFLLSLGFFVAVQSARIGFVTPEEEEEEADTGEESGKVAQVMSMMKKVEGKISGLVYTNALSTLMNEVHDSVVSLSTDGVAVQQRASQYNAGSIAVRGVVLLFNLSDFSQLDCCSRALSDFWGLATVGNDKSPATALAILVFLAGAVRRAAKTKTVTGDTVRSRRLGVLHECVQAELKKSSWVTAEDLYCAVLALQAFGREDQEAVILQCAEMLATKRTAMEEQAFAAMEASAARGSVSGAELLAFMPKRVKISNSMGRTTSNLPMPPRQGSQIEDGGARASSIVAPAGAKTVVPIEVPVDDLVVLDAAPQPAPVEEVAAETPTPKAESLPRGGQSPQTPTCTGGWGTDADSVIFDV